MNLHHSDACRCPRPLDSGRTYYTYRACRLCDRLIPRSTLHAAVLRAEAEAEARRDWERDRERAVGGLPVEGTTSTERRHRRAG